LGQTPVFNEDDLLSLSGLQHLMFCERQWGLIHIEQVWEENRLTAEGRVLHERVHQSGSESRPGVRIARGLRLRSLRLGLVGQADAVEFHVREDGVSIPELPGHWKPFPVEYKRGKPKANACDEVQLCAQALCLEEMYGCEIAEGALFYGESRRRCPVRFDVGLRLRTEALAARMHELYGLRVTPKAVYAPKCENCSLAGRCLPRLLAKPPGVARYLERALLPPTASGEE
jgi:CRISPR-associated exonuclease Cas4